MISIIDDDEPARTSLCFLLECTGLASRGFESCESFLSAGQQDEGCLVLDIHMPGMSGLELLEELRRRGDNRPVIMITAHPTIGAVARARAAGAVAVLEKPFKPAELLPLIEAALPRTAKNPEA